MVGEHAGSQRTSEKVEQILADLHQALLFHLCKRLVHALVLIVGGFLGELDVLGQGVHRKALPALEIPETLGGLVGHTRDVPHDGVVDAAKGRSCGHGVQIAGRLEASRAVLRSEVEGVVPPDEASDGDDLIVPDVGRVSVDLSIGSAALACRPHGEQEGPSIERILDGQGDCGHHLGCRIPSVRW